ncbi:MAG: glycosyl hydrolase family 28-related protein, partial [Phycisphaerae bacterium]
VVAGAPLTINGGGINANTVDVAIVLDTTGTSPATPPANALHPQILQIDKDNQYLVCTMPTGATAGVYNVWVKNEFGWSSLVKMNAARALFQSDYQAYPGLSLEVTGRNFDQSEFGGTTTTQLRLNNGSGGIYTQTITNLNPYNITFTVGSVPVGTYYVEVTNDGGHNWSRPSSGQTLAIIAHTGTDPLGLGVSWAQDFKWTNVFNVTNYGATGNDTTDDGVAIQNAMNAAQNAGGGIVYFPNGSYYAGYLSIGAGVVLEGQDQTNTQLIYDGTGGSSFIKTQATGSLGGTAQLQGVTRMSILLTDPLIRPDVFLNLGGDSASNRIIVANVNLNYSYTSGFGAPSNVINDDAAGITYSGAWSYVTGHPNDNNGDLHTTTTAGDYFQYTFTGSKIYYNAEVGPTSGNVDIYLDGIFQATVNAYSANVQYNHTVYGAATSTWGTHTLKVVNHDAGKTMTLDALNALTPRGLSLLIGGQERVLIQNNTFVGWAAYTVSTYNFQYSIVRHNTCEFSNGYSLFSSADYSYIEDNSAIIHSEYNVESHGIFTRANAYVANNYITGAGDASNVANDGEGICNEAPKGTFFYGTVTSATSTVLTVAPGYAGGAALSVPSLYYGTLSVYITYGTGRGQFRQVSAVNPAASTITVTQPFTIIPDATSTFTLYAPLQNFTVYNNTLNNCAAGILPYGNQFDAVVANNTLTNTLGVFLFAVRSYSTNP